MVADRVVTTTQAQQVLRHAGPQNSQQWPRSLPRSRWCARECRSAAWTGTCACSSGPRSQRGWDRLIAPTPATFALATSSLLAGVGGKPSTASSPSGAAAALQGGGWRAASMGVSASSMPLVTEVSVTSRQGLVMWSTNYCRSCGWRCRWLAAHPQNCGDGPGKASSSEGHALCRRFACSLGWPIWNAARQTLLATILVRHPTPASAGTRAGGG